MRNQLSALHGGTGKVAGFALCLLSEDGQPWPKAIAGLGFQPDVFGPSHDAVTAGAVTDLRRLYPGTALVPWTVNTPADLRRMAALSVAGITTGYPNRLLAILAGNNHDVTS